VRGRLIAISHQPPPNHKEEGMSAALELVSLAQAAQELGVTPDALRGAIARKALACVRIDGRTNMLTREEIERYRRENLGRHGKRMLPDEALTEQQRKQRHYQRAYYQRRKAARQQQQPAREPVE
jgi:hypothetical protein